ncbi:hypothetical protein [Mucilaginibacter sp. HD30]
MKILTVLKIGIIVIPIILIVLFFALVNGSSIYKDQVQTSEVIVKLKKGITTQERLLELKQIHELDLKISNEMLIVKWLIVIFIIALVIDAWLYVRWSSSVKS